MGKKIVKNTIIRSIIIILTCIVILYVRNIFRIYQVGAYDKLPSILGIATLKAVLLGSFLSIVAQVIIKNKKGIIHASNTVYKGVIHIFNTIFKQVCSFVKKHFKPLAFLSTSAFTFFVLAILIINPKTTPEQSVYLCVHKDTHDIYQMFYDIGKGFNEEDSTGALGKHEEDFIKVGFRLPRVENIQSLRIDLGTTPEHIQIETICLEKAFTKTCWDAYQIQKDFTLSHNISSPEIHNEILNIESTGGDPYIRYKSNFLEVHKTLNDSANRTLLLLSGILAVIVGVVVLVIIYLYQNKTQVFIIRILTKNCVLLILLIVATIYIFSYLARAYDLSHPILSSAIKLQPLLFLPAIILICISVISNRQFIRQFLPNTSNQITTIDQWAKVELLLLVVIFIFIILRVNFMGSNFVGQLHADKYGTYIPNLINMYHQHNPFINQNLAYTDLFDSANYSTNFGEFPFYQWFMLPFWFLTQYAPIEVVTRVLMTGLGALFLVVQYLFIKQSFGIKIALLSSLLLAVSPFFQLITFITIMDFPALIFMFISLILFLSNNKTAAYFFAGFAILMKLSFFAILVPVLGLLILFDKHDKTYEFFHLIFLSLLPYLLFKVFLRETPSVTFQEALIRLTLFLGISIGSWLFMQHLDSRVRKFFSRHKYILMLLGLPSFYFLLGKELLLFANLFLPSAQLFSYIPMYSVIVQKTFAEVPPTIFLLFIFGATTFLFAAQRQRKIILAFTIGSMTYLIVGAKAIYFHIYYRHIFVYLIIIISAYGTIMIYHLYKTKLPRLVLFSVLLLTCVTYSSEISSYIDRGNLTNIRYISDYLYANLDKGEKVLRKDAFSKNVTIYNPIAILNYTNFSAQKLQQVRQQTKENGFHIFLQNNNIKYLIIRHDTDFQSFLYWFSDDASAITREDLIRNTIPQFPDEYLKEIINSFELEIIIDQYYIYRVKHTGDLSEYARDSKTDINTPQE